MLDPKKQLSLTLAEPVAFLRTPDPSGRLQSDPSDPPTLVRGVLTLNVVKPIEISSIEAELTGVLAVNYPEAIGARGVELPERHKIYSSTVTVFHADQLPRRRLSASIGPGLSSANSGDDERRGRAERRAVISVPLNLGPSPPYTAAQSPPVQPRLGEHPARTLEELRQSLRENLEGQAFSVSPSCRSPTVLSLSNPTPHSDTSSTSNDSHPREDDNYPEDSVHAGSPLEGYTPFQHSIIDDPSHHGPPPNFRAHMHSPEHPDTPPRGRDASSTPASHSRLRLSITSVLDAVKEITSRAPSRSRSTARLEERERGRTRVRVIPEEQNRASILESGEALSPTNSTQHAPNPSHTSGHAEHHLLGLGRVLGLERDHETDERKSKEHGENWREFKPGTYSYPISFLLPPHLPPTFSLPNASLEYAIKCIAHRPGAFTSKLTCQVPLLVVASLAIGAGEDGVAGDPGPLFVQKQWQAKLAYSLGLTSRLFLLGSARHLGAAASENVYTATDSLVNVGVEARADAPYGTATLELTLLPIEKVKIWKLDVVVDQRIRYVDERGKPFREDDKRQVKLLEVQDTSLDSDAELDLILERLRNRDKHIQKPNGTRIPLLPTPISPHRSPLLRFLPPSTDPSVLAGPGPYTLTANIGLPSCNDSSGGDNGQLHFTMKQKSSNVKVEHSLRLVIRTESVGEEDATDHGKREKRRLFDISVQTPITILSCRCVPEHQTLPRYSQVTEDNSQSRVACPCRPNAVGPAERDDLVLPSATSSSDSPIWTVEERQTRPERSRSPLRAGRRSYDHSSTGSHHAHPHLPSSPTSWASSSHVPTPHLRGHAHAHSHSHSYSVSTSHEVVGLQTSPFSTPHTSRPPSPLARYERLVSGLESEAGEAPPSYESVASGP